jgi:hypothetical protein
VILQNSIRDDEPAAVRRLCLGVDKEHGLQLALFEAANIQKNIVGMPHARLRSMLIDKSNRFQKMEVISADWSGYEISDAQILSVVGSL